MVRAACHCGTVRISLDPAPSWVLDCNCSICRRYGALWACTWDFLGKRSLRAILIQGTDALEPYIWGDREIGFWRCKMCGCVTHHTALNEPAKIRGVNARLGGQGESMSEKGTQRLVSLLYPFQVLLKRVQGVVLHCERSVYSKRLEHDIHAALCVLESILAVIFSSQGRFATVVCAKIVRWHGHLHVISTPKLEHRSGVARIHPRKIRIMTQNRSYVTAGSNRKDIPSLMKCAIMLEARSRRQIYMIVRTRPPKPAMSSCAQPQYPRCA